MINKHTPGPWEIGDITIGSVLSAKSLVAFAYPNYMGETGSINHTKREEMQSNAHLISAAPELLEVLKLILEQVPNIFKEYSVSAEKFPELVRILNDAVRITKKAEGK